MALAVDRHWSLSGHAPAASWRDRAPRQGHADQRHASSATRAFEFLSRGRPRLVRRQPLDMPVRIWDAGCSTGEETYSIAMLFLEEIASAKRNVKLQVFASDVDDAALAIARNGLYPESIKADVSPARLDRFFVKEDQSYRVTRELREMVVFTTQDLLADAPFSRLDLVSCRNVLIYLRPEVQEKVPLAVPFRTARGGYSGSRRLRNGRRLRRPVRADRQEATDLPASRPQPPGRGCVSDRAGAGARTIGRAGAPGGRAAQQDRDLAQRRCSTPMRRPRS